MCIITSDYSYFHTRKNSCTDFKESVLHYCVVIVVVFKDLFVYLFTYYVSNVLFTHRKRAPALITDGCDPPCGCWELN